MLPEQTHLSVGQPGVLTVFRYVDYDHPFWVAPNRRAGRWHGLGEPPTQYWSLSPDAAWAELIRAEDLRTEAELDLVRMPLWVCRVLTTGLIDLRLPEMQEAHAIGEDVQRADDHERCRLAGARIRLVCRGIVSFSAALAQHANLTMFGPRRAVDWRRHSSLASTLPAAVSATGRPPSGLLPRVEMLPAVADQDSLF